MIIWSLVCDINLHIKYVINPTYFFVFKYELTTKRIKSIINALKEIEHKHPFVWLVTREMDFLLSKT